jgi:putative phosphoesterase
MKIGVLSDTHAHAPDARLERLYREHFADTGLLIHCGDHTGVDVHHWLMGSHPNHHAVAGNMDAELAGALPRSLRIEFGGLRIAAAHGWGPKSGVGERVLEYFGDEYDLVLYGHTHAFDWREIGGVHLCNPGAVSGGYGNAPSAAVITIAEPGAGPRLSCRRIAL